MESKKNHILILFLSVTVISIVIVVVVEGTQQSTTSRMYADMRSIAAALEEYKITNEIYPPYEGGEQFRLGHWLTTPIGHILYLPIDYQ